MAAARNGKLGTLRPSHQIQALELLRREPMAYVTLMVNEVESRWVFLRPDAYPETSENPETHSERRGRKQQGTSRTAALRLSG